MDKNEFFLFKLYMALGKLENKSESEQTSDFGLHQTINRSKHKSKGLEITSILHGIDR